MLFLLRSVVIFLYTALRSADLSKRNPEVRVVCRELYAKIQMILSMK